MAKDLTGQRFGRLLVLEKAPSGTSKDGVRTYARWLCKCDCGREKIVTSGNLRAGTKSCGCLVSDRMSAVKKRYCKYDMSGEYGIGYTHNTNREFFFDREDFDRIKYFCWIEHVLSSGYHALEAYDPSTKKNIRFSWVVVGKNYDHINRNPMDNRKCNLRSATLEENAANHSKQKTNTSGIIGVHWNKSHGKWNASLRKNGKNVITRDFASFEDAVFARLLAEFAFFGEFAPQRDLFEKYGIKVETP